MSTTVAPRMAKDRQVFAARLKALRAEVGLSQAELADASGIPVGTLRQYEYGRREPTYTALVKLAQGLGLSLSAFEVKPDDEGGTELPAADPPKPRRPKK